MIDYRYESSDKKHNFRILDVGGQRADRRKWIHHFDSVHALIFVASLVDFNSVLFEDSRVNSMLESARVFEEYVNLPYFDKTAIILVLNKNDLFIQQLRNKTSLSVCFSRAAGWPRDDEFWDDNWNNFDDSSNYKFDDYHRRCCQFIANIFLSRDKHPKRPIYLHVTDATNNKIVNNVFMHVQTVLIRNNMVRTGLTVNIEDGSNSTRSAHDMLQKALKTYKINAVASGASPGVSAVPGKDLSAHGSDLDEIEREIDADLFEKTRKKNDGKTRLRVESMTASEVEET